MEQPEKLTLTHEALGGFDDTLSAYLIVIESREGKIQRVYSVERPSWHRYYDKDYPYCPPNLN